MSSEIDVTFKSKISGAISNEMPSKYNSSKWSGSTGSQSGRVGTSFSNFSEAMSDCQKKDSPMTKKRHYNIQ